MTTLEGFIYYCNEPEPVGAWLEKAIGTDSCRTKNFAVWPCLLYTSWTNYVQLYEKNVPEFKDNIIVLDGDVPSKPEFRSKARVINEAGNFLFLPLVIEKGLFILLKDYDKFAEFQENYSCVSALNYDICFNEWPLGSNQYATSDLSLIHI